jgi:two-component system sensor kinase FixL
MDETAAESAAFSDVSAQTSELWLSSVLATAVDGIVVIDQAARILVFNKACESMFGYAAKDVLGANVSIIMPADVAGQHDGYIANFRRTGIARIIGIGREVFGKHRDGRLIPIDLAVSEAKTPSGTQYVGILRDLTARKADEKRIHDLQAELVHMARVSAIDEMGAAMAHELNQPLTAVLLYLQAVKRQIAKLGLKDIGDQPVPLIDKAVREAARAGYIVRQMRNFIEKNEPARKVMRLGPLVADAVELTRLGTRSADIMFDVMVLFFFMLVMFGTIAT